MSIDDDHDLPHAVVLLARVPSLTSKGAYYDIEGDGRGGVVCSCPAFQFGKRKDKERRCKHVGVYLAAQAALKRCTELHAKDGTVLCQHCLVSLLAFAARKVAKDYRPKPVRKAKAVPVP